jgi:hypothetical protein
MTCAIPSASTPSVPGFTGTHSSAFAPVSDIRDSTCTNAPRSPARPCRISTVGGALRHGEFHDPRKSAPKLMAKRERPRSIVGSCSWPKLIAFALRSTSSEKSR